VSHYTSQASADWGVASTWSPTGVPGFGDTAVISPGNTVTVSASTTVGDGSGSALDVAGILVLADDIVLSVYGDIVEEQDSQIIEGANSAIVSIQGGVVRYFLLGPAKRVFVLLPDNEAVMLSAYKDPGSTEDFKFDWSKVLTEMDSDSLATSEWEVIGSGGVTKVSDFGVSGTTTKVRLGGGYAGRVSVITNTVTLLSGQTKVRNLKLQIVQM